MVTPPLLAAPVRGAADDLAGRRFPGARFDHGQGASLGRRRKRGAEEQGIGRSRGGRTTKIHAVCDTQGRPIAFEVTPGQLGDIRAAIVLIAQAPAARVLAADCAYDARGLRQYLAERGTTPVIPNNPTRKHPSPFNPQLYTRRNIIERMFCRLKDWRRIATRYDKLAINFASAVALAAAIIWWC